MKNVERILIYRIGNLGDIVCAMPAMVALRRLFPNAWIGLLTNKESTGNPDAEEILSGNDFLDEIITYDATRLKELRYVWELLNKIRSLKADLLVYLSISKSTRKRLIRDWLFFRLAGYCKLIGFKLPKPLKNSNEEGMNISVFPQESDRLMSILKPIGVDATNVDFCLPIKEMDRFAIETIWNEYGLKNKYPVIGICPGAKFPVKRWKVERFAQIALILVKQFGANIVLIGGPSEKIPGEEIVNKTGNSVVNLIGKTNYMESAELISRCNLLISNDCGPVHLAAAVGTSVVGIYSSRDVYGAWHPWGDNHTVLRDDTVSCRFCFKTECETMECIDNITVEQVFKACQKYL